MEDAATGTAVDVRLQGAAAVAGQTTEGYVVYPAATATGASIVHRALAAGTEDFIAFDTKPAVTQVGYDLTLGAGAIGLRVVSNTLEVLDSGGAPRLRVTPPYIVGSDGVSTNATITVSGCAVDSNPAPPWGRVVTAPGVATCQVKVTWPGSGVSYPALLDPRWTTTGTMGSARQDHTMTLLANGKVLVTGGRSTTGTAGLPTAELYDRTTGTWSSTGSMAAGRFLHRATQLNTGSNSTTSGKVLISGGINGTTSLSTFQLYDPTAGTWGTAGNLNAPRHGHSATLLADGKVLVAGGINGTTVLASAAIYNPASGSGSWTATTGSIPTPGVKNHAATLIQTTNAQLNNKVLIVGGNSGSATISAVYLFDPAQSAFSTLAALSNPREQHTAVMLPSSNGKILVTGGKNGSTVLATALIFDPATSNGTWTSAGTMTSARVGHTATILPTSIVANGSVLVAGGNNGSTTLSSAELFSGTSTWTATPSMPGPLQGHGAVLLGNNMILVAGGLSNSTTVVGTARLYDASFGLGCTTASQCPTGFCINGICCDNACNGGCGACNLAGSLGTCTALSNGTVCRASAGTCDQAETCNGSSLTCPTDGFKPSSTVCRTAADECDATENCTGSSAACPADAKKANGTTCTDDTNPCTTDKCNGTSVACQHAAGNTGTQCRAAVANCDLPATCTGSSAICPANPFKSNGTSCPDDGIVCTTDTCNGTSAACQHAPGNGGTQCRIAAGECDLPGTCTGLSATCPANPFKANGATCNDDGNVCTTDTCNGSSIACQHLAGNAGTICRPPSGQCDLAESCTGSSASCPADGFASSDVTCRPSTGSCDVAEMCTGTAPGCPSDAFASAGTMCRLAVGVCDSAEACTGIGAECPADLSVPATAICAGPEPFLTLSDAIAKVAVLETANADGTHTYRYTLTNTDPGRSIMEADIGFNGVTTEPELTVLPIAWVDDIDVGIRATSAEAPPGWTLPAVAFVEGSGHSLRWTVSAGQSGLAPGSSQSGFSVTVPSESSAHARSQWTIRFDGGLAVWSALAPDQLPVYAVNSGGGSFGSFGADALFDGGSVVTGGAVEVTGVLNPAPVEVYSSARAGTPTSPNFSYSFTNLTSGTAHVVRMHFAETLFSSAGQRVFDVALNGSTILSSFDIVREYGAGKAGIIEFDAIAPASGTVTVSFISNHVDYALCSGIEIIRGRSLTTAPPVNIRATPHSGYVTLAWNLVGTPTGITVYRGTTPSTLKLYGPDLSPSSLAGTLRTPGSNGQTYYYRLSTSKDGVEGPRSAVISATPMTGLP